MFYRCYNGQPTDNTFYDILYERLNIYKIIYFLPYVYVFGDPTLIFVAITKSLIHLNDLKKNLGKNMFCCPMLHLHTW